MNQNLPSWNIDVNVLIIFFIREDLLEKTFEAVRQARPRRLLLWQDGARENRPDDIERVNKCRQIVENIDWECEVHKNYQTKNWGCDPSTFYSHKWAFSLVDKCIVLEDDCVPSQSFFPFCKELLDKYENDTRINRICGQCPLDIFGNYPYDYTFASFGSVWGWATWKRVANLWDENYSYLEDDEIMRLYSIKFNTKADKQYLKLTRQRKKNAVAHWEQIQTFARQLNSQLCIVPTVNLIQNIGLGVDSTHSNVAMDDVPKKLRHLFYRPSQEMSFPLRHPKYVFENVEYENEYFKITSSANSVFNKMKRSFRRIVKGDFKGLWKSFKGRLAKA